MPQNQIKLLENDFLQFTVKVKDFIQKVDVELDALISESDLLLKKKGELVALIVENTTTEQELKSEMIKSLLDALGKAHFYHDHMIDISLLINSFSSV